MGDVMLVKNCHALKSPESLSPCISFHHCCVERKKAESVGVKYWEIIADNLSRAGWSWGCVATVDARGRTIFVADAHRDDGKRFVVRVDEKLTRVSGIGIGDSRLRRIGLTGWRDFFQTRVVKR